MILDFNQYAQEGNTFVNDLARELGAPGDRSQAAHILRAVLHTLRDILPLKENLQLLSQFPMFMKGVYVDGWTGEKLEHVRNTDQFMAQVRSSMTAGNRPPLPDEVLQRSVPVVFIVLRRYVSLGELEDIKAVLPRELKQIVEPVSMF